MVGDIKLGGFGAAPGHRYSVAKEYVRALLDRAEAGDVSAKVELAVMYEMGKNAEPLARQVLALLKPIAGIAAADEAAKSAFHLLQWARLPKSNAEVFGITGSSQDQKSQ